MLAQGEIIAKTRHLLRYLAHAAPALDASGILSAIFARLSTGVPMEFTFDQQFFLFVVVGFVAQIIDGALGMAYGVTSSTMLLSLGVPPPVASASVHTAEVITSGVSGISHLRFGNVDHKLFKRFLIPGVAGGILGAYVVTVAGDRLKPFVAAYLLILGVVIFLKAFRRVVERTVTTHILPLALIGGFLDSVGGGGWGPIVTSTLVARGNNPRLTIGSVNLAEFFVSVAQAGTFSLLLGFGYWKIIIALIIGGVVAAPMAAYVCKHIPARTLMMIVGGLIILLSLRSVYLALR